MIKQITEKTVRITNSGKRPVRLSICINALIPTKRARLNAIDTTAFSSIRKWGKKKDANTYPGTTI